MNSARHHFIGQYKVVDGLVLKAWGAICPPEAPHADAYDYVHQLNAWMRSGPFHPEAGIEFQPRQHGKKPSDADKP